MLGTFCTTAPIQPAGHGGGSVSFYELEALQSVANMTQVLQPGKMGTHYIGNPFMGDYECSLSVTAKAHIAVFNGGPWSVTLRMLGAEWNVADCPAHHLATSVEEWERVHGSYPFNHMQHPELSVPHMQYLHDCDVIIVPARMCVESLSELGMNPDKCVVVPHGCVLPSDVPPLPDEFGIGYMGALGPDKGITYLINAWMAVGSQGGQMVLAGKDTGNLGYEVMRHSSQARTVGMGFVPDPADFWRKVSVYVQPSVTEGFALTILEAMSYGRPVIVTDRTGAAELVEDGVDGVIVPIRDISAIAEAIEWFRANPDKVAEMGQKARTKAEQYPWSRAQAEYERIISGRGPVAPLTGIHGLMEQMRLTH